MGLYYPARSRELLKPKFLKPEKKTTIDKIAKEFPECVKISKDLSIELEELLIAENYRYITCLIKNNETIDKNKVKQRLENFDYNKKKRIDLLRQAANRIENDPKNDFYRIKNHHSFEFIAEKVRLDFKNLIYLLEMK